MVNCHSLIEILQVISQRVLITSFTFPHAGTYAIKLSVTDNEGAISSVEKSIMVTGDGEVGAGCEGLEVWPANKTYKDTGTLVSYKDKKYSNNW
jgi:hypothetical protein